MGDVVQFRRRDGLTPEEQLRLREYFRASYREKYLNDPSVSEDGYVEICLREHERVRQRCAQQQKPAVPDNEPNDPPDDAA